MRLQRSAWPALLALLANTAAARVGGYGNHPQVNVQNRTANRNINANQNLNANRNINANRNVNVNQNVNVNRNVNVNTNVHGGYYGGCCYYHDNDWNWGSFAAGAAVGVATTAAVAAATAPHTTTVVTTPAIGSVVPALPGACSAVAAPGVTVYNCNNVYYRPYYQGSSLVYQVVTYP